MVGRYGPYGGQMAKVYEYEDRGKDFIVFANHS